MLTAVQCRTEAEACRRLLAAPTTTARVSTVLRTMTNNWTALANAMDRYDEIILEDSKTP